MSIAFLLASLVLAVTPGPRMAYIVARTLAHGRSVGLAAVAGVALGNLGNALGASLGLAALFAFSSVATSRLEWRRPAGTLLRRPSRPCASRRPPLRRRALSARRGCA